MAKPRLGQHFLQDIKYLRPMLQAAELTASDAVIEVGPGKGILTKALLKQAGRVLALELDERLADGLHARLGHCLNLEVRQHDARRADWGALVQSLRQQGFGRVLLVSNLPYYLATQMVLQVLAAPEGCERLVVMVQDEVARRMCAAAGGKDYSSYSVALQYYGEPRYLTRVPPSAFRPPPRVSSALVRIDRRTQPPITVPDPERFFHMVHTMFTHRRKTVRNCLHGSPGAPPLSQWETALRQAGVDLNQRPETLTLEQLAAVAQAVRAFWLEPPKDKA